MRARVSKVKRVVVLTGAGISAESGIQTFRAADGLWENHRVEDVASPEGFAANPELVQTFYNERRRQLLSPEIAPNPAHHALAQFEQALLATQSDFLLVTQNIDNLHERAGSKNIVHMHGELLKMQCVHSGQVFALQKDLDSQSICRCCSRPGSLRPHIVWFGEMPLQMERIYEALSCCDYFISIGTSGNVYPAAGFVAEAKRYGAHTVEVNLEPSAVESVFDEHIYGKAGEVLPAYLQDLIA